MKYFFSNSEELYNNALNNIKNYFKYLGGRFKNFKVNEKSLLNGKFKIKKEYCRKKL